MYVLQFLVASISSATKSIFYLCCHAESRSQDERLIRENGEDRNYASVEEARAPEERGLTSNYVMWSDSSKARRYVMTHLAIYLLVATVGFSFLFEKWPITDSIYFAVVVFTTVGYGDLSPSSDLSRIFTVCFALYGIIILGIFLGILGDFILDLHEENMKARIENVRVKVMEQFEPENNAKPPEVRTVYKDTFDVVVAMTPLILVVVALGCPIGILEGWDGFMNVYWMAVTGTTIGFGDLGPTSILTRCLCIVWIPLAVAVLGEFLGRVAAIFIRRRNDEVEDQFLARTMTLADLEKMDTNHDEKVSPGEFLRYMLVALQKVDKDDIDEIMKLFNKLDKSKTGFINKEDLVENFNLNVRPGLVMDATDIMELSVEDLDLNVIRGSSRNLDAGD